MSELASPSQLRAAFLRWTLVCVPGVLLLGFLSGRAANSGPGNPWFNSLAKPELYPPPATFGIVWTVLYVLMGLALAMVLSARGARGRGLAVGLFALQLLLNLAWSPVFFGMHQMTAALAIIGVMIVVTLALIALFWRVRPMAGAMMLPYLAWICFAAVLNYQFLAMNPAADGASGSGAAVRVQL